MLLLYALYKAELQYFTKKLESNAITKTSTGTGILEKNLLVDFCQAVHGRLSCPEGSGHFRRQFFLGLLSTRSALLIPALDS